MGWSYRKSVNIGPFRINVGKSGVGYSVGRKGFRTGVRSDGRRYQSVGIPGTGWRYTNVEKNGYPKAGRTQTGCALVLAASFVVILAGFLLKSKG
jgi:hypothetical protein